MTKGEERWQKTRSALEGKTLSVIMPVYNLASSIAANLEATAELFSRHGCRVELLPVDDGSGDSTKEEIEKFCRENQGRWELVSIRPVMLEMNGGKGSALRAGFAASRGEYVMLLDGDLDIKPRYTPFFFEQMVDMGADVVIGSKRHPRSVVQYPWHRRLVSWVYFSIVRLFIGLPITDTQTGMKLFKRKVLGEALDRMLVKTYAFDLELLAIAHSRGAKICEAPVVIRFGNKFGALKPRTVKAMAMDSLAVFYRLKMLKYYAKVEVPPKTQTPPLVSVVVACPGPGEYLRELVGALAAQSHSNWEAIILPDGEIDEKELAMPSGIEDKIRLVPTGKVRPAEKRNLGIHLARGGVVAFIDDDAYPEPHWLEYAVRYFTIDSVGAVGGPGVTPPNDSFLSKLGGRVYSSRLVAGGYRYRYVAGGVRRDVDDYPSCNLFVRKTLLDKIGGYRTDFWPGEDTLLCKDIIDSAKRIVYDPWVVVYHHRRALFAPHLRQLGRYAFHRGYFCKRYPSNSLHFSYFVPSLFVGYILAAGGLLACNSFFHFMGRYLVLGLLAPLGTYLALVVLSLVSANPVKWLLGVAGVVASHVCYGVRFIEGLLATKAPCQFIGKDKAK